MKVENSQTAKSTIASLPPLIKPAIREVIEGLAQNPYAGKPLSLELTGYYSLRYGRYRVIYTIDPKALLITVHKVGFRSEIYEKMSKELKKKT